MNRDIIYKELVQLDLEAESTDEVFSILAEKLEKAGYIRSGFLEAIKEREKNYPTALPIEPYPVAIPHTDPKCIVKPFVACVRLKHPIPWREMAANEIIHQVKFAFMLGFQEADAGESLPAPPASSWRNLFAGHGGVDLLQQLVHVHAMDHAGLLHSFPTGGRAAQAVHADAEKQRRSLRSNVQNVTDNGILGNLSHEILPPN